MPIILALEKEDEARVLFKDSLGYEARPCLKIEQQNVSQCVV